MCSVRSTFCTTLRNKFGYFRLLLPEVALRPPAQNERETVTISGYKQQRLSRKINTHTEVIPGLFKHPPTSIINHSLTSCPSQHQT